MLVERSPSSSSLSIAPDRATVGGFLYAAQVEDVDHVLSEVDIWRKLSVASLPLREELDGAVPTLVDSINFQPCVNTPNQDRYVVQEIEIHGKMWLLTGVFDGHLGETTVEHVAFHLPVIITSFLRIALEQRSERSPAFISNILSKAIASFDDAIAGDVLNLFPGGLEGLDSLSNEYISAIINDGGVNYKKARLCMYGTTALVALVDPEHEHLWTANLGDSSAVLVSETATDWTVDVLTTPHNGDNPAEVERLESEHPGEDKCVQDGRVLGVLGPFRCIGDVPFKQPPAFTRRILYNLYPGHHDTSPWEEFLLRNISPPYISNKADITYRKLSPPTSTRTRYLILHTDGLTDMCANRPSHEVFTIWAKNMTATVKLEREVRFANALGPNSSNMAMRLLKEGLGGEDNATLSKILLDVQEATLDDTTIVVQTI